MADINIPIGTEKTIEYIVKEEDTAINVGSGEVRVLATPRMLALMEEVSYKSVSEYLGEGNISVGTQMNITHLKASAIGEKLTIKSILTKQEDRKLVFDVEVNDKNSLVGKGECSRFIVNKSRFEEKAYSAINKK